MEESTEHVAVPVAGTKPIQAVNPLCEVLTISRTASLDWECLIDLTY